MKDNFNVIKEILIIFRDISSSFNAILMRRGMEWNKSTIWVSGRLPQISWIISFNSTRLLGLLFSTAIVISPHTFSIRFKSRKLAGHNVTCHWFSRNDFSVDLEWCGVAPSCWNVNYRGWSCRNIGQTSWSIFWYLKYQWFSWNMIFYFIQYFFGIFSNYLILINLPLHI